MADENPIEVGANQPADKEVVTEHIPDERPVIDYHGDPPRPGGWMYKSYKLGPFRIPWYASPRFQLGMVAFVCFLCPGMFNALQGLGGAGKADKTLADNMVRLSLAVTCGFILTDGL